VEPPTRRVIVVAIAVIICLVPLLYVSTYTSALAVTGLWTVCPPGYIDASSYVFCPAWTGQGGWSSARVCNAEGTGWNTVTQVCPGTTCEAGAIRDTSMCGWPSDSTVWSSRYVCTGTTWVIQYNTCPSAPQCTLSVSPSTLQAGTSTVTLTGSHCTVTAQPGIQYSSVLVTLTSPVIPTYWAVPDTNGNFVKTITVTAPNAGVYTITGVVTYGSAVSSTGTTTVTVSGAPPTCVAGDTQVASYCDDGVTWKTKQVCNAQGTGWDTQTNICPITIPVTAILSLRSAGQPDYAPIQQGGSIRIISPIQFQVQVTQGTVYAVQLLVDGTGYPMTQSSTNTYTTTLDLAGPSHQVNCRYQTSSVGTWTQLLSLQVGAPSSPIAETLFELSVLITSNVAVSSVVLISIVAAIGVLVWRRRR